MKIVIIGAGELGLKVASKLSSNKDVVLVDKDEDVGALARNLDVQFLRGEGTNIETLKEAAGEEGAACLLALSGDESSNVLSCQLAKKLGTGKTICRIDAGGYFSEADGITKETFGIDQAFSSIEDCLNQISESLDNQILMKRITFANPDAVIDVIRVPFNSRITDKAVKEIPYTELLKNIRIAALVRGNQLLLPDGNEVLQAGDRLYVSGHRENVQSFVEELKNETELVRRVVIAGTTEKYEKLIAKLLERGQDVRVIEPQTEKGERLLNSYTGQIQVLIGEPTSLETLREAAVPGCDAFVAMGGDDEKNILACLMASHLGAKKVVALFRKPDYMEVISQIKEVSNASWFNPTEISANAVLRMTTDKVARVDYDLKSLDAEIMERPLTSHSSFKDKTIQEIQERKEWELKDHLVIALILRDGEVICPTGQSLLKEGDSLVFIAKTNDSKLKKILNHF